MSNQAVVFKLWGLPGCPHCETAARFFAVRGLNVQMIPITDPVSKEGIKVVTGEDKIPILWSELTKDVIKGYNENEYKRVVDAYYDAMLRASTPNPPAAQSNDSGQTATVVAEKEPVPTAVV